MLYNLLPEWLYNLITHEFVLEYVYEIRVRLGKPIVVNYKGNFQFLYETEDYKKNVIVANGDLINYILSVATKQSLYAYNNQIKHCYITTDSGIRIGICGNVVYNDSKVATIKNINSLNIRISHQVLNCSGKVINFICNDGVVKNTLIISPPGAGKTTLIRDIALKLSNEKHIQNILVVDERYEIAGGVNNQAIDVGQFVDVISGSDKSFAFKEALKSMSPKVIITDEVTDESDIEQIKQTIKSGVKVIATAHAENVNDLKMKNYFESLIKDKYFQRIIVLSTKNGVGTVDGIYDENLRGIYIPYMIWKY